MDRRTFIGTALASLTVRYASAQNSRSDAHIASLPEAASAAEPFARLNDGLIARLSPEEESQRVIASPAPAGPPGRWTRRASMPIARSEMIWATAWRGHVHIIGGYGEGRVDRAYHHVYDAALDRWFDAAPLPRGANHVATAADAGRVYALGGFIEQNRHSDNHVYAYDVASERWNAIAPLPRPRG